MPHEYLEFEKDETEGLLLSADLLKDYREEEKETMDREQKKSPKLREGNAKTKRAKKTLPGRMKNIPTKRR